MFEKRISIFTGHFGSGKTEVAVNYAIALAGRYSKVAIVDMDIVNPFFRTADVKHELEKKGVRVIAPLYANTNIDVPALPADTYSLFENKDCKAVFDVGGDDLGAKAVSRFRDEISRDDYELFFVANTRRPMTDTPEKIEEMIHSIEDSCRLSITQIVNNTNLLWSTTVEDIMAGQRIIETVSRKLKIPIGFISCMEDMAGMLRDKSGLEVLGMRKLIRLPWEE